MKITLPRLLVAAVLCLPAALCAQAVPAPRPSPATDDVPLTLSPFVVEEAQDRGYAATSTLAGTRLRTDLRDVGAAISVVTSQFLLDTIRTLNDINHRNTLLEFVQLVLYEQLEDLLQMRSNMSYVLEDLYVLKN